jgi:hypothetical protein
LWSGQAADLTEIMIELLGRGFATVAAVLSFIADKRNSVIDWATIGLSSPVNSNKFSRGATTPTLSLQSVIAPVLTRCLTC